jgi:hypothetical protein
LRFQRNTCDKHVKAFKLILIPNIIKEWNMFNSKKVGSHLFDENTVYMYNLVKTRLEKYKKITPDFSFHEKCTHTRFKVFFQLAEIEEHIWQEYILMFTFLITESQNFVDCNIDADYEYNSSYEEWYQNPFVQNDVDSPEWKELQAIIEQECIF